MDLSNYLIQLLLKQDSVALQGFGIFTKNQRAAYIHPVSNSFSPARFEIKFEQNATCSDNGFTSLLSSELSVSQAEGSAMIDAWIAEINVDLKASKKYSIKHLGHLVPSHGNSLLFEEDLSFNFDGANFGLKNFTISHLPQAEQKMPSISAKAPIKKKSYAWIKYVAASLVLIGIFGYGFFKKDAIFAMFHQNEPEIAQIDSVDLYKEKQAEYAATTNNEKIDSAIQQEEVIDQSIANNENAPQVVSAEVQPYLVIAGCFKSEANAQNYVEQLKAKGFEMAALCGQTSGLYRVCYASYSNHAEANNFLAEITAKGVKGAWVQFNEASAQ